MQDLNDPSGFGYYDHIKVYNTLEGFESNLPETVTLLTSPSGSKVYLIGTAHFSLDSQNDVSFVGLII